MRARRTSLPLVCTALAVWSCSRAEPPAATEGNAAPAAHKHAAQGEAAPAQTAHSQLAQAHAGQGQGTPLSLVSERRFGEAPQLAGAPLPVEQLMAAPDAHLGKLVKCEGKVARVCEHAGCWLELQPVGGGEGLRVPMAGHAFFIPQDAVGHRAVIEGDLRRAELAPTRREHYQKEGMQALGPLALDATSVILH